LVELRLSVSRTVGNAPPGTFAGGQHWRPVQFSAACKCWKLTKNDWQLSFP